MAKHCLQLVEIRLKQRLQILVEHQLLVEQKYSEIELVDSPAHRIQLRCGLSLLHLSFKLSHVFLLPDKAAVVDCLVNVNTNAILVLAQSLYVESLLTEHLLKRVRKRHHIALQSGLGKCRNLRIPSLGDVVNRVVGGLLYQVILLYQRIIFMSQPLTLV